MCLHLFIQYFFSVYHIVGKLKVNQHILCALVSHWNFPPFQCHVMKVLAWLTIFQTLLCLISLFTEQYGGFCHPALQMRKPRRRDVKSLTPSDSARKGQDLNLCHHHKSKLVSACRALYRAKKMVNPKLS